MTDRILRTPEDVDRLRFPAPSAEAAPGAPSPPLLPVVAQDAATGAVLMLAYADRSALLASLDTGELHFWSRSRGELWLKGATSGNRLEVVSLHGDCDGDAVLARVRPSGPACHTGERSCFGDSAPTLGTLDDVLADRARVRPEGSYTVRLLEDENLRLKKLGEEAAELVSALAKGDGERATQEAADLLYHTLVALRAQGVGTKALLGALEARAS